MAAAALRAFIACALALLAACGPQLGELEQGESGRVVRAFNGDGLELDSGLVVFLAEIDAPSGEDAYAAQAQGELEALALHRAVRLAYGGEKRWRSRDGARQAALAHVFVRSEGGRWFWLQHELVARGAAYARPRRGNAARTPELMALEARARRERRGLWASREHRPLDPAGAAAAALAAAVNCLSAAAPYRIVEGRIAAAEVGESRAQLAFAAEDAAPAFTLALFGESFAAWEGPAPASLNGRRVRARGPLGIYRGQAQLCLDHASQLEIVGG